VIALVTGAAGFIGSHLCEHLLAAGDEVHGIDAFTDFYPRTGKEENLSAVRGDTRFMFVEGDLQDMGLTELTELVDGVEVVYHLAGQPGVRTSWGAEFELYVQRNVLATQRLLESCRLCPPAKLVFASSSSIYGDATAYPVSEAACPRPISPYGVTKLAAEHLCGVYAATSSVPTACLRLFTVYGPRQRPDMAFSRLVTCALSGGVFEIYGDGEQTRDATFVYDVATAMRAAAVSDWSGVANIGGGVSVSMNQAIAMVSAMCGPIDVVRRPASAGDVRHTSADTQLAKAAFGYRPQTTLSQGLSATVQWARSSEAVLALGPSCSVAPANSDRARVHTHEQPPRDVRILRAPM
jgi:nucleoside-diphosphate-sugar epimerase